MIRYPVTLTPDHESGGFVVTFPDVPEAITQGDHVGDALHHAVGALETALMIYMSQRRDLPRPSHRKKKGYSVALPALSEAKLALYGAIREARIRKADLARRLDWHVTQVDRLLDLNHASRLDQIEAALAVLGRRLVVGVEKAA